MTNLLIETIEALTMAGKSFNDVRCVCGNDFVISPARFKELADTTYDSGFGAPEVATDLKIVGDNWWLERKEYDGAESWAFKTMPKWIKMPVRNDIIALTARQSQIEDYVFGYRTLKNLNIKEEIF